jgi:hypothetical protein
MFARDLHRANYGLKANLLVLWVFTQASRAERFRQLAQERLGSDAARLFWTAHLDVAESMPFAPFGTLWQQPWQGVRGEGLRIGEVGG